MKNTKHSFGANLRKEINRKHLKYAEAAELFDISLGFLNNLMRSESSPSLEILYRIIEKLGVSSDALMFGDDRPVVEQSFYEPADLQSLSQIAAALNDLKANLTPKSEVSPELDGVIAGITRRLTTLDHDQLRLVNGFIDDIIELAPTEIGSRSIKAR